MTSDFAARLRMIVDAPQIIAVRHRRERAVKRKNLEAMSGQVELANDFWPKQRNHIRADRKLESGKHFFRHRRAAKHMAPLEHEHFFTGFRQVGGVYQTVMAASDNDDVVFVIHFFFGIAAC